MASLDCASFGERKLRSVLVAAVNHHKCSGLKQQATTFIVLGVRISKITALAVLQNKIQFNKF